MRNRVVRGSVLAMAMALCCAGVSGAADPDVFGDFGSPPSFTGPDTGWPSSPWSEDLTGHGDAWPEAEDEVVRLVNEERSRAGCDPLKVDEVLGQAAREHSHSLARDGAVTQKGSLHNSSAGDRARDKGYDRTAGEIVASGYDTAEDVVRAWTGRSGMGSMLMNCDVKETGVGVVRADDGPYWTQILGYGS